MLITGILFHVFFFFILGTLYINWVKELDFKFHFLPIISWNHLLSFGLFSGTRCSKHFSHHSQSYFLYSYGGEHSTLFTASSARHTFALPRSWDNIGFIPLPAIIMRPENYERVKESIQVSLKYAAISNICFVIIIRHPITTAILLVIKDNW
jgi:hypothetical protein